MRLHLLVFLFLFSSFANAELKSRHPDEAVAQTYEKRLSTENALASLEKIKSALLRFSKRNPKINESNNKADWETQNIALPNMMSSIRGALLKQDYLIKKYKYEIINSGQKSTDEYLEYKKAKKAFDAFWESFTIVD